MRPKAKFAHNLGVCVQPIFMLASFIEIAQFFEHWLFLGATKFYIYRNSYSKEVGEIIRLYQQTSDASIELIDWSDLPFDNNLNPNALLYRLEVMIAIFDCVHRAR